MSTAVALGVDVGGTNVRVAAVAADGGVVATGRAPTPFGDVEALVAAIAGLVREVEAEVEVEVGGERDAAVPLPVGVGVAGTVDRGGTVRYAANTGLSDAPVQDRLRASLERTVVVRNDATMAMWGESRAGAARSADDAVLLTLGTGVGGGLVVGGRLVEGHTGQATELGHVIVLDNGRRCPCGNLGCLEAYASGTSIGRRASGRLATWDRGSSMDGLEPVSGADVVAAARAGDELALEVLDEAGTWLGVGIASLVNALDPAVVVIGGGAGSDAFELLHPTLLRALRSRVFGLAGRTLPDVVAAELGDSAGVVGAALLARDHQEDRP